MSNPTNLSTNILHYIIILFVTDEIPHPDSAWSL